MDIAIIGSGISGLVCAHLLARRHAVTLFESEARLGGHTHTVEVQDPRGTLAVDTGFIVFNDWTYPNFQRLMGQLGVRDQASSMSFAVKSAASGLEYNGTSLDSLFAQRKNLFSPRFLGMVRDILRFGRRAPELLREEGPDPAAGPSLGEYLRAGRFGRAFIEEYIVPMGAAIWSSSKAELLRYPARFFVRFFHNHGMLSVDDRPTWRVLTGGSRSYLGPISAPFAAGIRLATPVRGVRREADGVRLRLPGDRSERFDQVVLACHSDTALALLEDPSDAEREILGSIRYQTNRTVLHTDPRVMPRLEKAWAAWNVELSAADTAPEGSPLARPEAPVRVTYWMNRLQSLAAERDYFVTLNQTADIAPERILRRLEYHHPVFDPPAVRAQARWRELYGVRRTWYAGAYWSWGFHEDGVKSGLRVAEAFSESL
jgi:predicted NAD/FAD-binding protein